jgi:hypothetical protein
VSFLATKRGSHPSLQTFPVSLPNLNVLESTNFLKLADLVSGMSFLGPECVIFPVYMLHLHQSEALRWQFVLKE